MEDKKLHVFEWSPVGMLLFEATNSKSEVPDDWVCQLANGTASNLLGQLPLEGSTLNTLFPSPLAESLADAAISHPVNDAVDFFVSAAGKWLLASGNRVENSLTVTLTDITRQKETAFADHRMKRLYQSLSLSLADHEIIIFDKNLNIILTEGQPRFVRLNVEGELHGRRLPDLFEQNGFSFLGQHVTQIFGSASQDLEQELDGKFYTAKLYTDARDDEGQENVVGVLLLKDVTELNQKQREIELRIQQLDRSNQELERFAYVASHDLQEPLRKIQSFGDRLIAKFQPLLGEEGQMYITRMSDAAKRMERLLDDLLLFSRATRIEGAFQPTDLQQTMAEVLHDIDSNLQHAQITIPDNLPVIDAVSSQMRQLFQNILNNALKFAKPDQPPVVRITCQHTTGAQLPQYALSALKPYCVVEFTDEGIGFEQENSERIFNIFQRLHG
ncbi:MAG: histidine kinase dimerization/phospho-acceptor domain-containing protein, partial [Saprospiraceae bacterium]